MVHVSTPRPSVGAALGQALGSLASNELAYQTQRGRLQNALQGIRQIATNPNSTPFDLASSLMEATAGIPGSERYVGQLYPILLQQLQAKKSQEIPSAADVNALEDQFTSPRFQRQSLPQFGQRAGEAIAPEQTNKFFPTNIGPQETPGNLPQQATGGMVRPVFSPAELINQARILAKTRTDARIPTTVEQAFQEVKAINDENKIFNQTVESERQKRIESQREYGQKAADRLLKLMPEATDEQQAIFKKIGEEVAGRGLSEAEIDRTISKEATKFKNLISNIQSDLSAPRLQNQIQRKFLGNEKDFESASNDLKIKMKPLLDLGLYDTSRSLLENLGYYPEERESIINPLSDRAKATVNLVPQGKKTRESPKKLVGAGMVGVGVPFQGSKEIYEPRQLQNLREGIQDLFEKDPNVSLLLARKAFEDKNYDWRVFKDSLNQLIQIPKDQGGISLNDDQKNQLNYLDSPPLNTLQKILHGLKIIGR